ncbi:hypothetical protein EXIGLDRAFT_717540 [Exidia glandulosa HHB12029]|uniref:SH3 domain-containing protein n=1 Tax=Exidia glandulosa HHB12029 TaxID=1314781 RepID=A0A165IAA0_EXIGL|nr:hypothetical protein EXIGLDRAFT_717540 [Exidia glandulosa HHB12029]
MPVVTFLSGSSVTDSDTESEPDLVGAIHTTEDSLAIGEHDVPLWTVTNGYDYHDATVTLQVRDKRYNVSKSRLVQRSPVFRDMIRAAFAATPSTVPTSPAATPPLSVGPPIAQTQCPPWSRTGQVLPRLRGTERHESRTCYKPTAQTVPHSSHRNSEVVAIALYDYEAREDSEINFKEGECIREILKESDDWWSGINAGGKPLRGLFPAMFVEEVTFPVSQDTTVNLQDNVGDRLSASPVVIDSTTTWHNTAERVVSQAITLDNEPAEFEHYLWVIHADILDVYEFMAQPASAAKCIKHLSIANVAHMYQSTRIANRSLGDAFTLLESHSSVRIDADLASLLVRTASRWVKQPEILARMRTIVKDAMRKKRADTFAVILVAEPLEDRELLGWGYYYLLLAGKEAWARDKRLRPVDRRRLLAGAYALADRWQTANQEFPKSASTLAGVPAWAIFDHINRVVSAPSTPATHVWVKRGEILKQEVERDLYTFFDPEPWSL